MRSTLFFSATSKKSLNITANLDLHLASHRIAISHCVTQYCAISSTAFRTSNQGTRVTFSSQNQLRYTQEVRLTHIKRQTYNHSSCPIPHLQVSLRNPHPHHILPYLRDRRRPLFQPIPSSPPIMPPHVALHPPTEHSLALRPDK